MSVGAKAATPERVGLPVLDAQAAELKAERLWGMADARKPRPSHKGDVDVSEVGVGPSSALSIACTYGAYCVQPDTIFFVDRTAFTAAVLGLESRWRFLSLRVRSCLLGHRKVS